MKSIMARLLEKVQADPNGCWIFTGAKTERGYGQTWFAGKQYGAHRIMYRLMHGEIEHGLYVCHRCDVPSCINPFHLFAATPKENTQDMIAKSRLVAAQSLKTHCPHGHPYEGDNLRFANTVKRYNRVCRTCTILRSRARRASRGAAPRAASRRPLPIEVSV